MIPRAHTARRLLALGLLAAAVAGCASTTPYQRALREGRVDEAARLFDADSALWHDEEALFNTAQARATPGSSLYRPALAREELDTLLARFPRSPHRIDALRLDSLLARIDGLSRDTARLARHADSIASRVDSLEVRILAQHRATLQLLAELRRTEAQLRAVEDELESLKAIDLRLSRQPRRPRSH